MVGFMLGFMLGFQSSFQPSVQSGFQPGFQPRARSALWGFLPGFQLGGAPAQAQGLDLKAVVELGNVPSAQLTVPDFNLIETHLTGRIPTLTATFVQRMAPEVNGLVSASLRQEIYQALTSPDLYRAALERIQWRQAGGVGFNPLYVPTLDDAYLTFEDSARSGFMRVGQFELPFGYRTSTYEPPLSLAPVPTPVTDFLSARGAGLYQGSTFSAWRDIGTLIQWQSGAIGYASGLVNGSGPNRMDDNGAKDVFLRLDYRASQTDEIGLSMLWGNEIAYPSGFTQGGIPTDRRRYGLHARFSVGDSMALFEYMLDQRLGLESLPRQGWYLDMRQPTGPASAIYLQYAAFGDANAAGGRDYEAKQVTLGGTQQLWERANMRFEGLWRWETATGMAASYGRYLATLEFALSGAPLAPERRKEFLSLR